MPADTKPIDLAGLRVLLEKMSPRPWGSDPINVGGINAPDGPVMFAVRVPPDCVEPCVYWTNDDHNGTVAIVNAAGALIDRVETLEAGLREALGLVTHEDRCGMFLDGRCNCRRAKADGLRCLLPPEAPRVGEAE